MAGVWVFKDGIVRRVENPGSDESSSAGDGGGGGRRKVLVHVPSGEVVASYEVLERRLRELGWERYLTDPCLLQFHQRSTVHLISVPRDFSKFKLVHMYDIVVKTRNIFEVRDAAASPTI
uniref:Flowering-promoting factor 1-like protein 3 n=1 Tax=Oryza punctata TaxID=4537 RepID=A0A0E0JZJ8_ORYPU